MMLSAPFTTFRRKNRRASVMGEPSVRTTLMFSAFLAIDCPFRRTNMIVSQHQMAKPIALTPSPAAIAPVIAKGARANGRPDEERRVDHPAHDQAVEDGCRQPRSSFRLDVAETGIDDVGDVGLWRRVGIGHDASAPCGLFQLNPCDRRGTSDYRSRPGGNLAKRSLPWT